jgi:hypothetical protein
VLPNQRQLRSKKYTATEIGQELPTDAERTTITAHNNFIRCHGSTASTFQQPIKENIEDLIQPSDKWAISSFDCPDNGKTIATAMIQGNAIAVCDGSYKDRFRTAGYVIQKWDSQLNRVTGAHVTPGHPDEMNPYRSELGGILAIVAVADAIAVFHDVSTGTIELGCDCKSALTAIFEHAYNTPKQPHHDLIHEICRKIAASKLTWKFRHVRGHQDKHTSYQFLDMWGQMNVKMDSLAKVYWNETSASTLPFYPSSTFGWTLWTGSCKLSSWDRQNLYNHAQSTKILQHWSERRNIPHNLITNIDWEAGQVVIKCLGLNKQLWIPKWIAGFAPVGKVLQRNKLQDHSECPRCAAFKDTNHVVLCTAPKAQTMWDASVSRLKTWLLKANTMPEIHQAILSRLQAWRTHSRLQSPSYRWSGVNDLVQAQDLIGWRAFLEGAVLKAWAAKQQDYYDWIQRRNTRKRWITTLIKKLWEISWNMWEHRNGELANPV